MNENQNQTRDQQHIDILNRALVIKWACFFGNQLCRNLTKQEISRNVYSISPDLREAVVCGGLTTAEPLLWMQLFTVSMENGDKDVDAGLCCTENVHNLDR